MKPAIAVIGAGAMGSAVGRTLVEHGCRVLAVLDGRSPQSAARAQAAGMESAKFAQLSEVDLILSIVPPAVAHQVAQAVASQLTHAQRKPVFADCNAISPATVKAIAAAVAPSGVPFIDAGIIGPPPSDDGSRTVFYAAGEHAQHIGTLREYGLTVEVLDAPIGAASAVKMSFAGVTKGVTAICSAMVLAASRAGAAEALHRELEASRPQFLRWAERQVPPMFQKAYRWVEEMQQIGEFSEDPAVRQIFAGISQLYGDLAADQAAERQLQATLEDFLARANERHS